MTWQTSPIFKACILNFAHPRIWHFWESARADYSVSACRMRSVVALRAHLRVPSDNSRTESFSPDKINQRRHADVACPLAGHTVMLGDAQFGQAPEFLFQQRAGVEIFDQRWPPGLVIELLGPIA